MSGTQNTLTIRCCLERDGVGDLEEFTNDLDFVARTDELSHLSSDGLSKIGTIVTPGLLLIGKIGKKNTSDRGNLNELEQLTATEDELRDYYNEWIYDGSVYAPDGCFGTVVAAFFENAEKQKAVVAIEPVEVEEKKMYGTDSAKHEPDA